MAFSNRVRAKERGQASVELVAALPFTLLLAALVWQCATTGHAALMAAHAARAAARAELVDGDPRSAARSALPAAMERGLVVERRAGGVRVGVRVPLLTHRWKLPVSVRASTSLGDAR